MRGENMRAHDQDIKLDQDSNGQIARRPIAALTNMPDAAQVQEVVVPSLISSGLVVSGTRLGSTEASISGLEDARRLLDKSSSSNAEDMRVQGSGVVGTQLETWRIRIIPFTYRAAGYVMVGSGHTTPIQSSHHMQADTNVAGTKKKGQTHAILNI